MVPICMYNVCDLWCYNKGNRTFKSFKFICYDAILKACPHITMVLGMYKLAKDKVISNHIKQNWVLDMFNFEIDFLSNHN